MRGRLYKRRLFLLKLQTLSKMLQQLEGLDEKWLERELTYYAETTVEQMDIAIGYLRLSYIFNIPVKEIRSDLIFGEQLDATFISDFRDNELTLIRYDVEDMELVFGDVKFKIVTVKDYVIALSRCRLSQNVQLYKKIVKDWIDLICATSFGRVLKRWVGFLPKRYVRKNHVEIIEFVQSFINGRKERHNNP
mgnify:CR=1 FL=1